jgi:hypothetical protein
MRDFLFGWFANNPVLWGPIVALLIFLTIFALVTVRVWRRGAAAYEAQARLPLEDRDE